MRRSCFTGSVKLTWPVWRAIGFVAIWIRTRFDGKITDRLAVP